MFFYDLVKKDLATLEEELVAYIPREPKEVYSFLVPYIKRGGKRIRPLLFFISCNQFGGLGSSYIKHASLIELFHNFTLIHDDIEDNSELRRGKPALHKEVGLPIALNSGDALYTVLWQEILLLQHAGKSSEKISHMYISAFRKVVEGQGIELNWHAKNIFAISESEYIDMIAGKTSALLSLSCELGGYLGGASAAEQEILKNIGYYIGLAFQIQDDILNVTGTVEKYKKEIGGDISEGKRTLMIVYALTHGSEKEQKIILRVLSSHSKNQDDIASVISILTSTGALTYAQTKANLFKTKAIEHISLLKDSKEKKALLEIAYYAVSREE